MICAARKHQYVVLLSWGKGGDDDDDVDDGVNLKSNFRSDLFWRSANTNRVEATLLKYSHVYIVGVARLCHFDNVSYARFVTGIPCISGGLALIRTGV